MKKIKINFKPIKAVILKYADNRFCVKIVLNNIECDCYVPCTSKLTKYINIENKECLVKESKGKYNYSLFAVKSRNGYIIIDTKSISTYFGKAFYYQNIIFESLTPIENYKADIQLSDNDLIEIKTIISQSTTKIYPDKNSMRFEKQLHTFENLINSYNLQLVFICFSKIKHFIFDDCYKHILDNLISKGLQLKFYSCKYNASDFEICFKEIHPFY